MIYKLQKSQLQGKVKLSGAKNSVLRLLAASLLTDQNVILHNCPTKLKDVEIHCGMLEVLGKKCSFPSSEKETLSISETNDIQLDLEWNDRSIRNTLLILGALLTRAGYGSVPLPGGCKLGERKYDLHVMLMEALGAQVWEDDERLYAKAPSSGLKGTDIHLRIRSTGATENAIICGTLAEGKTTVWNPHIRPEIIDLIKMLNSMGADIKVFGQERIEIQGVPSLSGCEHTVIPDNMEALTWLIGAAITDGDVEIYDFPYQHLEIPLIHLRESGARFFYNENQKILIVRGGAVYPLEISTGPYPGINSDMQPLMAVYAAIANGKSKIIDLRFPGRYQYAEQLSKMGFDYQTNSNILEINGGRSLSGATVNALDLRAGAALALAALVADGSTTIQNAWQIERGYNDFPDKLRRLNGKIEVIDD